mgnify:CR=1 FL=1
MAKKGRFWAKFNPIFAGQSLKIFFFLILYGDTTYTRFSADLKLPPPKTTHVTRCDAIAMGHYCVCVLYLMILN